jgi:hypothetical protein
MDARQSSRRAVAVSGFVLFVVAIAVAISVDVPRTGYGIKSDEATYVAAALSVAYDLNFDFDRHDLERFAGLYHNGPEGIFLKRGKSLTVRFNLDPPFVHVTKQPDTNPSRLYFGKAIVYPLFAAPFVRFLGLNGLLVFHVLLLALAAIAAYLFLEAQSSPLPAAIFTTAFLGASVLPVYAAILMPEIFTFTLVFLAYFLWLHKEVAPGSWLNARWTDPVAAALLGVGTYAKPIPVAALLAPIVVLAWTRRRWARGIWLGLTAVVVAGMLFGVTAAISGEFNYQGGDRKVFYGSFPFDAPAATWEHRGGKVIEEPGPEIVGVLTDHNLPRRFWLNVEYFLVGRHSGFVPFFFPGAIAILTWLLSPARRDTWRILTFGAFGLSAALLLLALPFTWNGGGGPSGNRYLVNVYPTLFFLMPPAMTTVPGLLAWIGGALFTAKMLANPFVAAKYPWLMVEKGPLRRLPVELTMADDLPEMLVQPPRVRIRYGPGDDRRMLLYFLDENVWPPERDGMWVSGAGRADIIVSSAMPIRHMTFEAESPISTVLTVTLGAETVTVRLDAGHVETFTVGTAGVRGRREGLNEYLYLLTARSTEGFVPHFRDPSSRDYRNLGAELRFRAAGDSADTPP